MRKKDREIQDQETILCILNQAPAIRIALCVDDQPYIVPMSFGYRDDCIYLHAAQEGRKIEMMKKNNRVAFQTDIQVETLTGDHPCSWSVRYLSLAGSGRAYFIDSQQAKKQAMDIIMAKYSGSGKFEYTPALLDQACLIRIEIEEMTGKKSG